MASSNVADLTARFNAAPTSCIINVAGCDWLIVQVETSSAGINFNASLDGGSSDTVETATGFQPVQGTNVATGFGATSAGAGSGIYRFQTVGTYLQLAGAGGGTVDKLLVYFSRIN